MITQPSPPHPFRLTLARGQELELVPHRPRSWASSTSPPTRSATAAPFSIRSAPSNTPSGWSTKARDSSTSAPSRPARQAASTAPARARSTRRKSSPACCRCSPACAARATIPISVDTRKAAVARAALDAGADLLNDVSGLEDPELRRSPRESAARWCSCTIAASSRPGLPGEVHGAARKGAETSSEVVGQVRSGLAAALARALAAGCRREQIVLDPGLGFGKRGRQNLELLRRLGELAEPRTSAARRCEPQELPR